MSKSIVILLLASCLISVSNTPAANNKDTLTYLQFIVANKANYIGRPFSALLSDLQIQIKRFAPIASIAQDMSKETSTNFSFYFPQSIDEFHLTFPKLNISWQTHLNATTSQYLFKKYNKGGWTQEVIDFYSTAIIKNIELFEE